jgi:type II secretory pathway pseudopilin PulG
MRRSRERGFSYVDIVMYLTMVALTYHYAVPSFQQLFAKIRSQELIKTAQEVQLQVSEYAFLQGELPQDLSIEIPENSAIEDIQWDGYKLQLTYKSAPNQHVTLELTPSLEDYYLKWDCTVEGAPSLEPYLCYALT